MVIARSSDGAVLLFILVLINVRSLQSQSISPKLDFDDSKEPEPTSSTARPTTSPDSRIESVSRTVTNDHASGKSGPKIHGVRVTVDTGDDQKSSKVSKESVEINDNKSRKRVGIHTDITFEITGDIDNINTTTLNQNEDKEENDASVPIFKGRKSSTTNRPRKPFDPRSHWNPNYSGERRIGSNNEDRYNRRYPPGYPVTYNNNGGDIYRGSGNWATYVPMSNIWTTERSYYESYRPNTVGGYRAPSWKPCYCVTTLESRRRRDHSARPTSSIIQVVDKLDNPFSTQKK